MTKSVSEERPRRWPAFVIAALSASFITYIIPEAVSVALNPPTVGIHNLVFPLAMTCVAGLDIWLCLGVALWLTAKGPLEGAGRDVLAGLLAGGAYVLLAFAFSFATPVSGASLAELAVRTVLTPLVQARSLALHRVVGWGLADPPLGWSFVLSPIVGCAVGGWLYGLLAPRKPRERP
jgi:hypothetical protein